MKTIRFFQLFLFILFLWIKASGQSYPYLTDTTGLSGINTSDGIENPVTIRVIYDNYVKLDGLNADWGYSVLIEGLEKEILFDTGANPKVFMANFNKMGINAAKISCVVLSHEHGDHTNGLPAFAGLKNDIPIIIPNDFSASFKKDMEKSGLHPLLVKGPAKICRDLYTSGEFKGPVPEQALVLNTRQGLVVMTGCSHPGIVEMLEQIKSTFGKNIFMVFGGFHLLQKKEAEMETIIQGMKALGVVKCGATHCTGDKQMVMIREAFGANFIGLGAGNVITIN